MLIGASITFFIAYGILDIVESICRKTELPAVLTNLLYLVMICMACVMGGGLGIVYGINDIEGLFTQSLMLVYSETYNVILGLMPIGLIIGICFGFFFGLLRAVEIKSMP